MSYKSVNELLEKLASRHYLGRERVAKKVSSVLELDALTTLSAQVAALTNIECADEYTWECCCYTTSSM